METQNPNQASNWDVTRNTMIFALGASVGYGLVESSPEG